MDQFRFNVVLSETNGGNVMSDISISKTPASELKHSGHNHNNEAVIKSANGLHTQSTQDSGITIIPQAGWIGAEIYGVDLRHPLSPQQIEVIKKALYQWKVVFFRDQFIDHQQQIDFGRQFGRVTAAHPYEGNVAPAGFPEIHTVSPAAYRARYGKHYQNKTGINGPGWHADLTALVNPPAYSILRAERVPDYGGDTQFTNVAIAYSELSAPLRKLIDGLHAEHRFGVNINAEKSDDLVGDLVRKTPLAAIHPVVRIHPETGEPVIYVNPSFTKNIVELGPRENRHLLDLLYEHIVSPQYTVRFRWQPGSIAFWDNRSALHLAPNDFEHIPGERVLHRITLEGDIPVGPDGKPSTLLAGEPFLGS